MMSYTNKNLSNSFDFIEGVFLDFCIFQCYNMANINNEVCL